jgi:general stress protein 26
MTEATIGGTRPAISDEPLQEQRADLFKRLEKTPTCMLITHDAGGNMRVRPMTTQRVEEPGVLWLFVGASSHLAADIEANPNVLLTYADTGDSAYAAVRGIATVLRDPAKAKELWSKFAEAWFPGGPDDPNLALLCITLASAEHWEPPHGKVIQFLQIATAAITHNPPDHDDTYRNLKF